MEFAAGAIRSAAGSIGGTWRTARSGQAISSRLIHDVAMDNDVATSTPPVLRVAQTPYIRHQRLASTGESIKACGS